MESFDQSQVHEQQPDYNQAILYAETLTADQVTLERYQAVVKQAQNEKLVSDSIRADNAKLMSTVERQSEQISQLEKSVRDLNASNEAKTAQFDKTLVQLNEVHAKKVAEMERSITEMSHAHKRQIEVLTHLNQSKETEIVDSHAEAKATLEEKGQL